MANKRTYTDVQLAVAVKRGDSWSDVLELLGKPRHYGTDRIKKTARALGLDTAHLDYAVPGGHLPVFAGPPGRTNTSMIGARTEGIVLGLLARLGKSVLLPFGGAHPYDLAVDDGGRLVRIQCKTAVYKDGCVVFRACAKRRDHTPVTYRGAVDAFAVYCPPIDKVYLVPVDHVTENEGRLRVEPVKNHRGAKVRWAAPYELTLDGAVAQRLERPPAEQEDASSSPSASRCRQPHPVIVGSGAVRGAHGEVAEW